ncbi:MAG: pentapeptide repeat-containing protein [Rhodospirillaceae bacterium]|nr:pentapeptide repeat-containing protein [Rhodospirillaceae bacterium]
MSGAKFGGTNFAQAHLDNVTVDLKALLDHRRRGQSKAFLSQLTRLPQRDFRNWNFQDYDLSKIDITGSNLAGVKLRRADLRGVNAGLADFRGARLEQIFFDMVKANGADFRSSRLNKVFFRRSQLKDVDFRFAVHTGVAFGGSTIENPRIEVARVLGAKLNNTKLIGTTLKSLQSP